MYQIAILNGYWIVGNWIWMDTGSGYHIQKTSVVLSQLYSNEWKQLSAGVVNEHYNGTMAINVMFAIHAL